MELQLILIAFPLLWKLSSSLQCFKCDPERLYKNDAVLCEKFDSSSNYVVDCEHSSMCYKRVTTLDLGNGVTTSTTVRGCAAQTMSGNQAKINGKWRPVNTIYDVYEEGCSYDPTDIERTTKSLYCYCRGDLCNGVGKYQSSLYLMLVVIINLFISYLIL
ncbi:uncharacterized protein LOC106721560 [Papilio machaon]|uniref:uncharacterized protein LOC106721560 n=1 Tax=Papilio machaon TaxID=76193 RepID=UPI001E664D9C|nr:uncharacterized protein LOC106721560 [Papilio machaon]